MDFIMSNGEPLLCLESKQKSSWGGIERLTMSCAGAQNDYDRACQSADYTAIIPVTGGFALVLGGELGAGTSIWHARSDSLLIVQICCAEADVTAEEYLERLNEGIFVNPASCAELNITSADMILFDSAEPGNDILFKSLSFRVDPGRYHILTQVHDPSPDISFLLHKFEKVSSSICV